MNGATRAMRGALCALCALLWAVLFFFPMPARIAAGGGEQYLCAWEDGTETSESFDSAYRDLCGIEGGAIVLEREGVRGVVALGARCEETVRTLENGGAAELLSLDADGCGGLERAALFRAYSGCLWYDGEWLGWTGRTAERTTIRKADKVVLLSGRISPARLAETGAETLCLRAAAEFGASSLVGTEIGRVVAEEPYRAEGNAVCLFTPGGARLLAGLPQAESVVVSDDVYFADEGALLACTRLTELVLPFAGNAKSAAGSAYRGELAYLFSTGEAYKTPQTLRKVRVKGGSLVSHAFYACPSVEEIDACGVPYNLIERDAFADCTNLRLLHTPRADVRIAGTFTATVAPCGCTVYKRVDTENR